MITNVVLHPIGYNHGIFNNKRKWNNIVLLNTSLSKLYVNYFSITSLIFLRSKWSMIRMKMAQNVWHGVQLASWIDRVFYLFLNFSSKNWYCITTYKRSVFYLKFTFKFTSPSPANEFFNINSPLTSPFSFHPWMDLEFHHWSLLKRKTFNKINMMKLPFDKQVSDISLLVSVNWILSIV